MLLVPKRWRECHSWSAQKSENDATRRLPTYLCVNPAFISRPKFHHSSAGNKSWLMICVNCWEQWLYFKGTSFKLTVLLNWSGVSQPSRQPESISSASNVVSLIWLLFQKLNLSVCCWLSFAFAISLLQEGLCFYHSLFENKQRRIWKNPMSAF